MEPKLQALDSNQYFEADNIGHTVVPPCAISPYQAADWLEILYQILFRRFLSLPIRITISCYYFGRLRPENLAVTPKIWQKRCFITFYSQKWIFQCYINNLFCIWKKHISYFLYFRPSPKPPEIAQGGSRVTVLSHFPASPVEGYTFLNETRC